MKKYYVPILTAAFFFLIGFMGRYHLHSVETWILSQIEETSRRFLPIKMLARGIELSFFPVEVHFKEISFVPNETLSSHLSPGRVERMTVRPDLFRLLKGQLLIDQVKIERPDITLSFNIKQRGDFSFSLAKTFELLHFVPLSKVQIEHARIRADEQSSKSQVLIEHLQLKFQRENRSLKIGANSPQLTLQMKQLPNPVTVGFGVAGRWYKDVIEVDQVKILKGNSFFNGKGVLSNLEEDLKSLKAQGEILASLELPSVNTWLTTYLPKQKFPTLFGHLKAKMDLTWSAGKLISNHFRTKTTDLKVDQFTVGELVADGLFESSKLILNTLAVSNDSGSYYADKLHVDFQEKILFSTVLKSQAFELQKLLLTLGIGPIPVLLDIDAEIPCSGELHPNLSIQCRGGWARARNLDVAVGEGAAQFPIVKMNEAMVRGDIEIDPRGVKYSAQLQLEKSQGRSSGYVEFLTGFECEYETDEFFFSDLTQLITVPFEGQTRIKGSIKGNSSTSSFYMDLKTSNFWIDNYAMGEWTSRLFYKKGHLLFQNLQGIYGASRYFGEIDIDLSKATLSVVASFPYVEARNLAEIFSRKIKIPVEISGSGTGKLSASGPFDFTKLTYRLDSTLYRGTIDRESFDQIHFNVHAKNGEAVVDRVQLSKGRSVVILTGKGHPDGTIQTEIQGKDLRLEESETINHLARGLNGKASFVMKLEGPVRHPFIELKGQLTDTTMNSQRLGDSEMKVRFSSDAVEGSANLMSSTVITRFLLPLKEASPFSFYFSTSRWNFVPFLSILTGTQPKGFTSEITGVIDLSSPRDGLWNASGKIDIDRLILRRGPVSIGHEAPLRAKFANGVLNTEGFVLSGKDSLIELKALDSSQKRINTTLIGKINMEFLTLFAPVLEELRGNLGFSFQFSGERNQMEMLGSAFSEGAYVKLSEFPYPFEGVRTDLLFSQSKLIINSLTAKMAGGNLSADGTIMFKALRNIPTRVKAQFQNISLDFPEKVHSEGSGELLFSGDWFPFLLSGSYKIKKGLFTREFDSKATKKTLTKRASFLPQLILQNQSDPLLVDLMVELGDHFTLENSLVDGEVTGSVQLTGPAGRPQMVGSVKLKKGTKIFFKDTPFEVTASDIVFQRDKPDQAQLYISASSRVKEYDVGLTLQGSSENPSIDLSSQPPLTKENIISLLTLGLTTEELEQTTTQVYQSSVQLGTQIFTKSALGDTLKNPFGLKFQISSENDTINTGAPKFTVSKQWTPRLLVKGSQTLGQKSKTEGVLEYQVNENWSSILWMEQTELEQGISQTQEDTPEKVGIDMRYKVEFK